MIHNMLPKDTQDIIEINSIDNFNLRFNKAAQFTGEKFEFFKTDKGKVVFNVQPNYSKIDIEAIRKRYKDNISKLCIEIKSIMLKPDWHLIVGLGNESVYETSMTLHHIYGIPYIPGSAIKGVTRNGYINNIYDEIGLMDIKQINVAEKVLENFKIQEDRNLEYEAFKGKFALLKDGKKIEPEEKLFNYFSKNSAKIVNFQNIFGTPERIGRIIFFDAFPLEPPHIEPDIMNVHYPDYYGGKKPPTDYQNPIPIYFLTVKETPFEFIVGIREQNNAIIKNGGSKDRTPMEVVYEYMKKALSEHGIGAKTAVGYGYFGAVSKEYEIAHMTEKQKKEAEENKRISKERVKRKDLITTLSNSNDIDLAKSGNFPVEKIISYYKDHLSDKEYEKLLFDVMFAYKKVEILKKQYHESGIANDSFELYKFVKENNEKIKTDVKILETKLHKIIKKLGGERLKLKWQTYTKQNDLNN